MKRDSYIFYRNWWENFRKMPDNVRLNVYDGIMQYAFENNMEGVDIIAEGLIGMAKPLIDKDRARYEAICERNKANGIKGGRPKTQQQPKDNPENPVGYLGSVLETQKNPKKPYNDIYINNDKDKDNININNIHKGSFTKPTIEEIKQYAAEKGYIYVDAEMFWNFYESKGWYVGKNKMSKWRSAVANWNKTEEKRQASGNLFSKQVNTGVIQKDGFEWNK